MVLVVNRTKSSFKWNQTQIIGLFWLMLNHLSYHSWTRWDDSLDKSYNFANECKTTRCILKKKSSNSKQLEKLFYWFLASLNVSRDIDSSSRSNRRKVRKGSGCRKGDRHLMTRTILSRIWHFSTFTRVRAFSLSMLGGKAARASGEFVEPQSSA